VCVRIPATRVDFATGDRAQVNLARTTRTRFYSARKKRLGSVPEIAVDRGEMNPAAASERSADARRLKSFRQIVLNLLTFFSNPKEKKRKSL